MPPLRNSGFAYREQLGPDAAGLTALEYYTARHTHSTRETWAERFRNGEIELAGARAQGHEPLRSGQWLVWNRPPWDEPEVPRTFDVLYEDGDLLAVDKPSGLPTAPAGGFYLNTLQALVQERDPAWHPMHRLGRGTSGIVLFARNDARSKLQADFRAHRLEKRYLARVTGALAPQTIRVPIGELAHPRLGTIFAATPDGKRAETIVERVEGSLAQVRITTGRPHQIRIHLAYVGHPLAGDPLYLAGGAVRDELPGELGYALNACQLRLTHPRTGELLEINSRQKI